MSCGQRSHLCVVANVFALERSTICCSIQRPILLIVVEFTIVPLRRWDRDRKTLPRRPSALFCLHRTPSFLSLQNVFQLVESVGFLNLLAMRHIAFEWILFVTVWFRITLGLILDVYFLLIWKMTLIYVDICAHRKIENLVGCDRNINKGYSIIDGAPELCRVSRHRSSRHLASHGHDSN